MMDMKINRSKKTAVFDRFYGGGASVDGGALVASYAKNCDFENGALRCGFGVLKYRPDFDHERNIGNAAPAYGHPKVIFTALVKSASDGIIRRTLGSQTSVNRIFLYSPDDDIIKYISMPKHLRRAMSYVFPDGTVRIIFCCANQLFFYDFVNKSTKILTEELTGACLFHERLFVTTVDTVKYTAPMELAEFSPDFNGGGEIKFQDERGEIVWIEPFGERVYLFFQYGIAELSADGEGSEFRVTGIPYKGGWIIPQTVCAYEGKLVFAAYDGIYVFDGKKASRIKDFKYTPVKNSTQLACAACVENRYFLRYLDEAGTARTLFVDLEDSRNTCECMLLHGLSQSGGKALCAVDMVYSYLDRSGDLGKNEGYTFLAKGLDFGSGAEKSFTYLALQGVGSCSVTVTGRSGSRTVAFDLGGGLADNGSDTVGMQRKRIGVRGREFSVEITLQKGCVIKKMTAEYDELGGAR